MGRLIDETGNKYGKLTVLHSIKDENNRTKWLCKCDCGNEIAVKGTLLRNGNTKSCGCYQKERAAQSLIDLVGKKFGKLLVLERDNSKPKGHQQKVYWICECECGNIISVDGTHLKSGHTKSCGCYNPKTNFVNEIGNVYGKLTVVEEFGRNKDGRILWLCKCQCGNEKIALGKSLRAGLVLSCGCLHSKGEERIQQILKELNIDFISQYHTDELKNDNNYYLYFDFYLPDYNVIIEYQGEQHYSPINRGYYNDVTYQELKLRDEKKREFCHNKGIRLIEIPYTDYYLLNQSYIKEVVK